MTSEAKLADGAQATRWWEGNCSQFFPQRSDDGWAALRWAGTTPDAT